MLSDSQNLNDNLKVKSFSIHYLTLRKHNKTRNRMAVDEKMSVVSHRSEKNKHEHEGHDTLPAAVASLPKDSQPDPWGSGHRKLYMVCTVVYLCSTMNGQYSSSNPSFRR